MNDDWYKRFGVMRANLFEESSEAAKAARDFYCDIVGNDAIVRLTVALNLDVTEGGQDWAIEVADSQRTAEFLNWYETGPLDDDERYWLLELIIASLEDHLSIQGLDDTMSARVEDHLLASFEAHRATVSYWACLEETEATRFAVTPLMRKVLARASDFACNDPTP